MKSRALLFCNHTVGRIEYDAHLGDAAKRAYGVKTLLLTHGRESVERARQAGFDVAVDLSFTGDPHTRDTTELGHRLVEFESQSGGRSLREDITQDRWLAGNFSLEWSLSYLASVKQKVELLMAEHEIQAAVGEVNYAAFRMVRRMLEAQGKPFLLAAWARVYDRFYFDPSFYSAHNRCVERYLEYRSSGTPPEPRSKAEMALHRIVELRRGPSYQEATLRLTNSDTAFEKITRVLRRTKPRTNGDGLPASVRTHESLNSAVRRGIRKAAGRRRYSELVTAGSISGRTALYLLHTNPEYQVNTCGWPFRDEVFLIERIAEALPVDMTLIVKEHQLMLGRRSAADYDRIARIENVRFVPASSNARDLISNSDLVCTISGNGAIEALAFGVPAIAFSPVFYTAFEGIDRCRDLLDLPVLIRDALHRPRTAAELTVAAFGAMYSASRPGIPFKPNGQWGEASNLELLRAGFTAELSDLVPSLSQRHP